MAATGIAVLQLCAQESVPPAFEVVSLKHVGDTQSNVVREGNRSRSTTRPWEFNSGKVSCKLTLMAILTEAYGLKPFQVQGPAWMQTEVYELAATMPDPTPRETARLMIQTMLKNRLGMVARKEEKEFSVFRLVEVPGNTKLEELLPTPTGFSVRFANDYLEAMPAMPLSALAGSLSNAAGRPVLDETGRAGYYKIKLQWNADPPPTDGGPIRLGVSTGMLTALPQIGLKLESAKKMLDSLVIEKANKEPTEN
jgi:uncharacterized protein (TIGR03435 family)